MSILLKGRPATEREDARYIGEMTEALAWVTPEEHGWLTHPRDGLHTVCKFLPTPADAFEFIRQRRSREDQFKPIPPRGPVFRADDYPDPRPEGNRRKEQVKALLGYDPDVGRDAPPPRPLVPPTAADLDDLRQRMSATPAKPITREFRAWAEAQGLLRQA